MSGNRLAIASVVLVALLGLTVWRLNTKDEKVASAPKASVELPKFERDAIEELVLAAPDKPKVRLVKKGEDWQLAEPVAAKADANAVKTALDKLGELEITGVAATKAKNHERLEVDAAKGTRVTANGGGKPLLDAYIGVYRSGNSMLRLEGQESVATVKGSIRYAFAKELREWRDRRIAKVETDDVNAIAFTNSHGEFRFEKSEDSWKQVAGPKIDPLDETKLKGIVGSAASLNAVDFAAADISADKAGLGETAARFQLEFGGDAGAGALAYRIGSLNEKNYYLQMEGDPQIYLVSNWIGGRLSAGPEVLTKKEGGDEASPKDPATGEPTLGSRANPIPVLPQAVQPGAPPGTPPGHPPVSPH
ncbi:MAG: DUF4340 domain-containing protein [Myxococcales bacterium]|nr:DUF4340 domain-containing protein [Myxococcales bacterium]